MANRNYFNTPIQSGGRSAHDYGHTRLTPNRNDRIGWPMWIAVAIVIAYFIWQYAAR